MGVRGVGELVAVLPAPAAESARAVAQGLADLQSLRHAALAPEEVRALGELWERFTAGVASGRLGVLAAIDARDDVVPKARVGEAGAVFAHHGLGQRRGTARRDARWAWLLRAEVGDLPAIGAALAAGDVTAGHVEVAVRAHRDLGPVVREQLVECQVPDADPDGDLRAALAGLSDAFTARVRQIRVVDAVLAQHARRLTVAELEAVARRIVAVLNPPSAQGGHQRRFLHMSQLPDGAWVGRFSCGPGQGLLIKRALAAGSAPRPGTAVDADGVQHTIPDPRDLGARQIDALHDLVTIALTKTGINLSADPHAAGPAGDPIPGAGPTPADATGTGHGTRGGTGEGGGEGGVHADPDPRDGPEGVWDDSVPQDAEAEPEEPPPGQGEPVVLRHPGVLAGPYPSADLVLVAGIEHVAAAWAHHPDRLPVDLDHAFNAWLRDRLRTRTRTNEEPADKAPADKHPADKHPADKEPGRQTPGRQTPGRQRTRRRTIRGRTIVVRRTTPRGTIRRRTTWTSVAGIIIRRRRRNRRRGM
jgi:hypothetical protein